MFIITRESKHIILIMTLHQKNQKRMWSSPRCNTNLFPITPLDRKQPPFLWHHVLVFHHTLNTQQRLVNQTLIFFFLCVNLSLVDRVTVSSRCREADQSIRVTINSFGRFCYRIRPSLLAVFLKIPKVVSLCLHVISAAMGHTRGNNRLTVWLLHWKTIVLKTFPLTFRFTI